MNSIFHRTSIRQYQNQEVEQEKIEQIVRAAMASPSAANQQPWEFYVVTNKEKLSGLAECSPYAGSAKNAPLAFVLCYRKNIMMPDYAEIDLSACTQNMLLEIDALGLGGVWLGIAPLKERMEAVKKVLEMPDDLEAFAIVPCGYPVKINAQQDRYEAERIHYVK